MHADAIARERRECNERCSTQASALNGTIVAHKRSELIGCYHGCTPRMHESENRSSRRQPYGNCSRESTCMCPYGLC